MRGSHYDRTPQRRDAFLRLLREGCSVAQAARAIGLGRRTMFDWKRDDEDFREAWDDAVETITENIESALARAALGGDTVSMIVWLKAHRPETYNRKQVVAIGGDENAPPVMLAAAEQQPTGPVFILPHNGRDPVPSHMQPPPGFTPRPRIIEAEAEQVTGETENQAEPWQSTKVKAAR
jgi:hypothetical protein